MAYVGTYNGLRIFDITDISAPVDHGVYSTSEPVSNLEAQGSMVLMVERDEGFRLLDVSDPANPVLDFQLDSYNAEDVCIQDTAAYMLESGGLLIYDISNPQSPALLSDTTYYSSQQIEVEGDFGAIMAYSTVRVLDLSDLTGPVQTDTFSYQWDFEELSISGSKVYVAYDDQGLSILDISDPYDVVEIGTHDPGDRFPTYLTAEVFGEYAFIGTYTGVRIYDISVSSVPSYLSYYNSPEYPHETVSVGNYSYTAADADGLVIMDITDRQRPKAINYVYYDMGHFYGLDVKGDYAYATDIGAINIAALKVFDISDPYNVDFVAFYPISTDWIWGVTIYGDNAYIACKDLGMLIIDIAGTGVLSKVGEYVPSGDVYDIAIENDIAYVGHAYGFSVVDISEPSNPLEIGTLNSIAPAGSITLTGGGYCYIASPDRFSVVDIDDPRHPQFIKSIIPGNNLMSISMTGDFLYASTFYDYYNSRIIAYDISDRESPVQSAYMDVPGLAIYTSAHGNEIYAGNAYRGLFLLDNESAAVIAGTVVNTMGSKISEVKFEFTTAGGRKVLCKSDEEGYYFTHLKKGADFTVTPFHPMYYLEPDSRTYTAINGDFLNDTYTAIPKTAYTLSGDIKDQNDQGIPDVELDIYVLGDLFRTVLTTGTGSYNFSELFEGATYTVIPERDFFRFEPGQVVIPGVSGDHIQDFTGFTIKSLEFVKAYPNPVIYPDEVYEITFEGYTEDCTIRIYTISGELIKELTPVGPQTFWDLKNDEENLIASGVYIYSITDPEGNRMAGKIAVIKSGN